MPGLPVYSIRLSCFRLFRPEVGQQSFLVLLQGTDAARRDAADGVGPASLAAAGDLDVADLFQFRDLDAEVARRGLRQTLEIDEIRVIQGIARIPADFGRIADAKFTENGIEFVSAAGLSAQAPVDWKFI